MILAFDDLPTYRDHVLIDGAFDPLHAGHVHYIAAARTKGPLVCSVASDDQIREKGKVPFLTQDARVAVMEAIGLIAHVYPKDRPTEQVLEQMLPSVYVKGPDWRGKLPYEQIDVLARYGIPAWFPEVPIASSSRLLKAWALADAEQSVDRLEFAVQHQKQPTFDTHYFTGEWRGDAPFTYEARKKIEGRHPKIVKECFDGLSVLDVGCGPGHFVRMLRELGVDAGGIDPSEAAVEMSNGLLDRVIHAEIYEVPNKIADVAICREVCEHVPVREILVLVNQLFRVARKFVYITTRFNQASVFDVETEFDVDPTHITLLSQPFLRSLCVLNGGKRRRDLEEKLDWMKKGRVLVYEVTL